MFKSIQYQLYIYTLLLIAAVAAMTWLLTNGHYIFAAPVVLVIALCLRRLKTCYDGYNKNIIFLLNALENGDYTYRFSEKRLSAREREMNSTFNRIKEILELARKEVIENEHFLSIILESVSTGIIIVDAGGIVHKVNRTAMEMLGLRRLTHLNQLQAVDESYPELFRNLKVGDSCQLALTTEREEFPVSLRVSQISLKRGMMRVMTLNNIGNELEMKEMESWIRLIRVMTHEIMNSIAPVTSLSETMMNTLVETGRAPSLPVDEIRLAFETINSTATGLLSFVESYRKFTSVPNPKKEPFDMPALVEQVVKLHEQMLRDKGQECLVTTNEDAVFVNADENLIRQVIVNLLKNAIEVSDCKCITIAVHKDADVITVEVANNGSPISPDILPHIFVPFFTTKSDGSGIGLSVSRYIMRLHNGKLQHFTTANGLTVFQLTLPMIF
ncbi:MAG: HAMP domain-containing histidine kinase [Tannerella sp.]|jgi:nitrogen fixation/metabolism regulation signal transduction histidine kinase|nr:HAMP domain-containing histidine kinase [Tannerella sp.]